MWSSRSQSNSRFKSSRGSVRRPLSDVIADLEGALDGTRPGEAMSLVADAGVDAQLLSATVAVRAGVGRLNDHIHAAGIARALPYLLEADETVTNRPSLAAGNDPSRPFDLETDRRICEFKFSRWTGSDAMRKRGVFKDFVELGRHLRATGLPVCPRRSPRPLPAHHDLQGELGLDRAPSSRRLFAERFGALTTPISSFVATQADRVRIVDLEQALPDLFA
jgi:hypothetical protein